MPHLKVGPDDRGVRLDKLVMRQWHLPRALVAKAVRRGWLTVEGKRTEMGYNVQLGEQVDLKDRVGIKVGPGSTPEHAEDDRPPPPRRSRLREAVVVFHDPELAVFDKPSGVPTHGGTGHVSSYQDSARETLQKLVGDQDPVPDSPGSFVHRLDRDASGLLIYGRSTFALRKLSEALREGRIHREYLVMVKGKMDRAEGELRMPLRKAVGHGRHGDMVVADAGPEAKEAVTRYRVRQELDKATLLSVSLGTGRTHQIRAHFATIGHPLLGDGKYGDRRANADARRAWGLRRLFLHAYLIRFPHPRTGEACHHEAPLPKELAAVVEKHAKAKRSAGKSLGVTMPRRAKPTKPARGGAGGRSSKPARGDEGGRPSRRGGKPARLSWGDEDDRPARGGGRPSKPSRGGGRPSKPDRDDEGGRPSRRGGKPARLSWGDEDDRPARGGGRPSKPSRGGGKPSKPGRGDGGGKPSRGGGKPSKPGRGDGGGKPSRGGGKPSKPGRGDGVGKPSRGGGKPSKPGRGDGVGKPSRGGGKPSKPGRGGGAGKPSRGGGKPSKPGRGDGAGKPSRGGGKPSKPGRGDGGGKPSRGGGKPSKPGRGDGGGKPSRGGGKPSKPGRGGGGPPKPGRGGGGKPGPKKPSRGGGGGKKR